MMESSGGQACAVSMATASWGPSEREQQGLQFQVPVRPLGVGVTPTAVST